MLANPYVTKQEMAEAVGISVKSISANIAAMRGKYLNRVGPDKGGFWEVINDMDNITMVCKTCNSSKADMDLFEWYAEVRKEWPPINVFVHYMKNIYLYSIENGLMDKHCEELDAMDLPFNWRYIPVEYPLPEMYLNQTLK